MLIFNINKKKNIIGYSFVKLYFEFIFLILFFYRIMFYKNIYDLGFFRYYF